eukprot:2433193-Pleurochrysis_carterae.AAC.4
MHASIRLSVGRCGRERACVCALSACAENHKLRVGDVIIAVNGHPLSGKRLLEVMEAGQPGRAHHTRSPHAHAHLRHY